MLTNLIEPSDVGRPMERVQEKMESLGMLPSSVSVQSVEDDKPQGQPVPQSNGDSGRGSCKEEWFAKNFVSWLFHKE